VAQLGEKFCGAEILNELLWEKDGGRKRKRGGRKEGKRGGRGGKGGVCYRWGTRNMGGGGEA